MPLTPKGRALYRASRPAWWRRIGAGIVDALIGAIAIWNLIVLINVMGAHFATWIWPGWL